MKMFPYNGCSGQTLAQFSAAAIYQPGDHVPTADEVSEALAQAETMNENMHKYGTIDKPADYDKELVSKIFKRMHTVNKKDPVCIFVATDENNIYRINNYESSEFRRMIPEVATELVACKEVPELFPASGKALDVLMAYKMKRAWGNLGSFVEIAQFLENTYQEFTA